MKNMWYKLYINANGSALWQELATYVKFLPRNSRYPTNSLILVCRQYYSEGICDCCTAVQGRQRKPK